MFDVFYIGSKPGIFPHEQSCDSIQDAQDRSRTRFCWIVTYLADYTGFDFLWEPPQWQQHFTHVWPSQWHDYSGTYLVPKTGAIEFHFHSHKILNRSRPEEFQCVIDGIDFDWSWAPHPLDPPYTYVFGNQWHRSEIMPTVEYRVPGAIQHKFMPYPQAVLLPGNDDHWKTLIPCEFDRSWRPDPGDPPFIYVFGNQWHRPEIMPTVEYHVPGATSHKFMTHPRARLSPDSTHWQIPQGIDADSIDLSWMPDPGSPAYIYQFGTQWQKTGGPCYVMPDATDVKYMPQPRGQRTVIDPYWQTPQGIDPASFDYTWHPDSTDQPFIYEFGTQWQKTGGPRYHVPGATEVKFVSAPRGKKITRDSNWEIPDGAVYDEDFDWTWHPDHTEKPYVYQFGTQHQKTGGPVYRVPGATEVKYVDQIRVTVKAAAAPVYVIDHIDGNAYRVLEEIGNKAEIVKTTRYVDNYLNTLQRIAAGCDYRTEYIWICSSVCDYTDFDFTWYPEQWQATMLHVFASDRQKFGDTFFMHVPSFQTRSGSCQLLDWYDVNYVPDRSVPRRPMPVICHDQDSHVAAVKTQTWQGPLALFTTGRRDADALVTVPLWREATKTIVPLSRGACSVIVPKVSVPHIRTQLYDYPYIDRTQRTLQDDPLDVVFISNGEPGAEHHYDRLQGVLRNHDARNRLHRVDGVKGRVAAYQAAANQSHTPWFFSVFAKLEISEDFDWGWQPDRMQQPKHYIFHAYNPVNHLVYGHQAMIAYNRSMTLENLGTGLDFTLDQLHEVVPIVSGTARYDNDAWTCWRTAFRECIKLRHSLPDVENQYRLEQWLRANTQNDCVKWSHIGAQDAVQYYDEVGGDFDALKKSYEWQWLSTYAMMLHPELVTQSRT